MGYQKRLDNAFQHVPILPLNAESKYVLFSDCHRGNGTNNDNFLKNQHLYIAALKHYYKNGFTYIELGDGDELWENRKMEQIKEIHSEVFQLLSRFYCDNRLYMIYGNHDIVKKSASFSKKKMRLFLLFFQSVLPASLSGHNFLFRTYSGKSGQAGTTVSDPWPSGVSAQLQPVARQSFSRALCVETVRTDWNLRPHQRCKKLYFQTAHGKKADKMGAKKRTDTYRRTYASSNDNGKSNALPLS